VPAVQEPVGPRPQPRPKGHGPLVGAIAALVAAVLVLAAVVVVVRDTEPLPADDRVLAAPTGARPWTPSPYAGLGAWVDTFDFVPSYPEAGDPPAVRPEHMVGMHALGARTLYLQAAAGAALGIVDDKAVGDLLVAAHEAGLQVVAWYLPLLSDLDRDLNRARAIRDFRYEGHRFDGLAIDIEWISSVPDNALRSERLVEYTRRLDELVDDETLGAIVMPPVQIEDVNPAFWPGFPWTQIAEHYDVWMPMAYWSVRRAPWDDAALYTSENIRRVRERVGDPDALVHPVGGVADDATEAEYDAFVDAAIVADAIGWSIYDFRTLTIPGWYRLVRPKATGSG